MSDSSPEPVVLEGHRYFSPEIGRVLQRTPARHWSAYAVLLDGETGTARLMLRGELVAWLRANDLADLAGQAHRRRVATGAVLALALTTEGPRLHVLFEGSRR